MKNDGSYFQLTKVGKYYPETIIKWKWKGIEFFISPEVGSENPNPSSLNKMEQNQWHKVVTHKETGYVIPDINSSTSTDAKICAEISLDRVGYDGFLAIVSKVRSLNP